MSESDEIGLSDEDMAEMLGMKGPESLDANLEEKVVVIGDPVELEEDTPPDEATPAFIVTPATAARRESVRLADGTPVGVWLHEEYPDLDGGQVAELLVTMGLDGNLAAWFGIQRDKAREASGELDSMPAVQKFAESERLFEERKARYREAYVKAMREKERK